MGDLTTRRAGLAGLALAAVACGCTGQIGASRPGATPATGNAAGMGSGGGTATGAAGAGVIGPDGGVVSLVTPACATAAPNPGRSPLRRLNLGEYATTVHDLLGVDTSVTNTFPPDQLLATQGAGFTNNADALVVTALLANAYMTAAEQFATAAVANLATLLPCDHTVVGDDACATQFIADFGRRAFRRTLTTAEKTQYLALYTSGKTGATFADGISLALEAFLQSPSFLYRVEKGAPAAPTDAVAPVTSFEMATRLSYFLWGTTPDEALLDVAEANQLETPDQIAAQVTRLLDDPRAHDAVTKFHTEWLNLAVIPSLDKDKTMFPEWTPALALDLFDEAETFVDKTFWGDAKSDAFFSSSASYANAELAKFYGLPAPTGTGFQPVAFDPAQRRGLLTMGGILAANAKENQTSPVLRGKFVREQMLCQQLPPPPANLVIVPPQVTPGTTTRQRFAMHEAQALCASCHTLMDGMGVGFENYDPLGRWRTTDQGLPIDASGTVTGTTDLNGTFDGVVDLAGKFENSQEARGCLVTQWFRFANGRSEVAADACTLQHLAQGFEDSGHDMRDLLAKMAGSDAFRYRATNGGGQ
jgi:Protein of unknown function (DUF1592)/Protein of unknown function (DUF1588)/Protein of unknown function (DUF1595)/Protein of unknown function (DUF1587)/Protein of unknown function (DUF1585)